MIVVTGDTHGHIDYRKLDNHSVKSQFGQLPDYVIIAGDFGVPWSNDEENKQDLYMKKWYEEKPYDVIVVLGNHENYNRIEQLPLEDYHEAKVRRYGRNIVFVERNQILELEGKKIYCIGGAESTDKEFRSLFETWWPQEEATYADFIYAQKLLEETPDKRLVNYVVSHTAPEAIIVEILGTDSRRFDGTSKLLTYISKKLIFTHWYFGHFHEDMPNIKQKYTCVYNEIRELK